MKIVECSQNSPKWLLCKRGKPSASNMHHIVTPTGKPCKSAARQRFMMELIGERITGRTTEHFASDAMRRGTELEAPARSWYTMKTGNEVRQVGFAYEDKGRWGCSPDGLCAEQGGLEIKVPTLPNMIAHLLAGGVPSHWQVQIQSCLWITERKWWDFCMYTDAPHVPSIIIRCERDDKIIDALAKEVPTFCEELSAREKLLREKYGIPPLEDVDADALSGDWCPWSSNEASDER